MMFRPLPVMTICVVVSLGILAMLGNWQWQRYGEKLSATDAEVQWVDFFGGPVYDQPFFVSTVINGRSAWKHVAVSHDVRRGTYVLVTYFITFQINPPEAEPFRETADFHFDEGVYVTPSKPGIFTPEPSGNAFFAIDVEAIRDRLSEPLAQSLRAEIYEPRRIYVRDDTGALGEIDNPYADPVLADPLPPARHLGYAFTWWGIGAGLFIIYLIFHIKAGRLRFGNGT